MATESYDLPLPNADALTRPFWEACREHRLLMQRCSECSKLRFYPSAGCHYCSSEKFEWAPVSGRGKIYSWIVVRRTVDAAWQKRVPFVTAIVELDEQSRLLIPGLLSGIAPEEVHADMPVQVWFEDVTAEISMPRWQPAKRPAI